MAAVKKLNNDIGITQRLSDYGVTEADLPAIAKEAIVSGNVKVNPRDTSEEDLINICRIVL